MDDVDVRPRIRPVFKLLFWTIVMPIAVLFLLGAAYIIFAIGIEHY